MIGREGIFQSLPGLKIPKFSSGIEHSGDAHQMALFANAVAGYGFKLRRIHDGARFGIGKMFSSRAVAALTSDALFRKSGGAVLIVGAGDVKGRP